MSKKTYAVNSIFGPTLQGEGHRAGTATMFLRLSGCNLQCVDGRDLWEGESPTDDDQCEPRSLRGNEVDVGWFCDTDFKVNHRMPAEQVLDELEAGWLMPGAKNVVITGGEPGLQLDFDLVDRFHSEGWFVAVETNGTTDSGGIQHADWVSCSPKLGTEGKVLIERADEIRIVVRSGQEPHDFGIQVRACGDVQDGGMCQGRYLVCRCQINKFVSPAWEALSPEAAKAYGGQITTQSLPGGNLAWAVKWCLDNPDWRLSVQQHKLWGIQ